MDSKTIIALVRTLINDAACEDDTFTEETDAALQDFLSLALQLLARKPGVEATPADQTEDSKVVFSQRPDGLWAAEIRMPDNLLRFVSVWLEGWSYPVARLFPDNSPAFMAQYTTAKGVANGPYNPMAFVGGDRNRIITAHAVKTQGTYRLRYIPTLTLAEDGTIPLPEKYASSLAYYTAALYHESVGERQLSEDEMTIAGAMFEAKEGKEDDA
jgi:hypothetical protein